MPFRGLCDDDDDDGTYGMDTRFSSMYFFLYFFVFFGGLLFGFSPCMLVKLRYVLNSFTLLVHVCPTVSLW